MKNINKEIHDKVFIIPQTRFWPLMGIKQRIEYFASCFDWFGFEGDSIFIRKFTSISTYDSRNICLVHMGDFLHRTQ